MAIVNVVVTGTTKGVAAKPVTCELAVSTAQEAVAQASSRAKITLLRDQGDALAPGVALFINGADVRFSGGLRTSLSDADVVTVVTCATDT